MKKILSICSIIILVVSLSVEVFAFGTVSIDDLVKINYIGDNEVKVIDCNAMKRFNDTQLISDERKITHIFDALGIDYIEYSNVYDELVADIDCLGGMISSTSYYEFDAENSVSRQISKSEYLSHTTQYSRSTSVGNETISDNEYMRITTTAVAKTNEAVGTYSVMSYYEWLSMPLTRKEDAVSIASDNITWDMGDSDGYSAMMISDYVVTDEFSTEENTYFETKESPDEIVSNGFYYSFDLLSDDPLPSNTLRYTSLAFLVTGKGRVDDYDDGTQMLWINSRYAHIQTQTLLSAEFGWELGEKPGVTITRGAVTKKYYSNYLSWDYSEHFDLY